MTDKEIVEGLIARDENITRKFFFVKCRPLMYNIIGRVFAYDVDYDELINELYVHLMENDAARLRSFSYSSSVFQWIKTVAIRFFQQKRDRIIENESKDSLYRDEQYDPYGRLVLTLDVKTLIADVTNARYRWVLQKVLFEDVSPEDLAEMMNVTVANFYNIKKRAMNALVCAARNEVYGAGKDQYNR